MQIRLDDEEKRALEAQARRERLDPATWARRALLEIADRGAKDAGEPIRPGAPS